MVNAAEAQWPQSETTTSFLEQYGVHQVLMVTHILFSHSLPWQDDIINAYLYSMSPKT